MDTVQSTSLGPGLVAFLIVVFLAVATVALWYSMVRHLRKVPSTFEEEHTAQTSDEPDAADAADAADAGSDQEVADDGEAPAADS